MVNNGIFEKGQYIIDNVICMKKFVTLSISVKKRKKFDFDYAGY
jgi:hypothetical protein